MTRADLCIGFPTYARPERCQMLLEDITACHAEMRIVVVVLRDGLLNEMPGYGTIDAALRGNPVVPLQCVEQPHQGKAGFWKTTTALWQAMGAYEAHYYLQLQDDVRLVPGALTRLIATWEAINVPHKIALNPLVDTVRSRIYPGEAMTCGAYTVIRRCWLDCMFVCERRLFEALGWHVDPPGGTPTGTTGTGVGPQVARRLLAQGYSLWQVAETCVRHGAHKSLFHATRQQQGQLMTSEPITAGFWLDRHVSQEHLARLLSTLAPQVDHVHLAWRGPGEPPPSLARTRHITITETIPLPTPGYYVIVDPSHHYTAKSIALALLEVEAYNRQQIIVLDNPPIQAWHADKDLNDKGLQTAGRMGGGINSRVD